MSAECEKHGCDLYIKDSGGWPPDNGCYACDVEQLEAENADLRQERDTLLQTPSGRLYHGTVTRMLKAEADLAAAREERENANADAAEAEIERDAARADAEKAWGLADRAVIAMTRRKATGWLAAYEQAKRERGK